MISARRLRRSSWRLVVPITVVVAAGAQTLGAQRGPRPPAPVGSVTLDKPVVEVPISAPGGRPIVEVMINGAGPFRLGIETGMPGVAIFPQTARRTGIDTAL